MLCNEDSSGIILRKILDISFMASAEREPITESGENLWSVGPPEPEDVLAFVCQKEVAKLPSYSVFC